MKFQQIADPTGSIAQDLILYTSDDGVQWFVPEGHRFWTLYQNWLSAGNQPEPASLDGNQNQTETA